MDKFIRGCQALSTPAFQDFAASLVSGALPLLKLDGLGGMVLDLAIHAAVVFLCGQNPELEPLRRLAFAPATMVVREPLRWSVTFRQTCWPVTALLSMG